MNEILDAASGTLYDVLRKYMFEVIRGPHHDIYYGSLRKMSSELEESGNVKREYD